MNSIAAEKVPTVRRGRGRNWSQFIVRLQIGAAVCFEDCTPSNINSIRCSVKFQQRQRGFMYRCRTLAHGDMIVTRKA